MVYLAGVLPRICQFKFCHGKMISEKIKLVVNVHAMLVIPTIIEEALQTQQYGTDASPS